MSQRIQPALKNLRKDGHLFRRYRDREASFTGTLEDYAIPIAAVFDL